MSSLAPPVLAASDDRHIEGMMRVMHAAFDPAWGEAWTEPQLASAMLIAGSFARHALDGEGKVQGFSLCSSISFGQGAAGTSRGGEAELLLIAVAPAARGKGLGAALLSQSKTDSRNRGLHDLFLEVRESNTAARGLYDRLGFIIIGRRKDYYIGKNGLRHDAVTMRCPILR